MSTTPSSAPPSGAGSAPTPPAAAPAGATASAFSVPIFRAIWLASMSSNFGALVQAVGASWLMTQISTSERQVALVQASTALPIMLFSLVAGAVADNLDRRAVMLGAQGFMLAVSALLALCAWAGVLTPWLLLGFTFAIGCGTAFNNPAWQASVGDMVPRAALPDAVALNSMGFNIARSVGPAIGGAIVAAAGAAGAFATNAVSYLALIVVLWRWRPEVRPRALPRERIHLAMADGLRYVAMSPRIGTVLLRGAVFGAGASAVPALMPLVARDLVTGGPLTYGLLLGSFGLGAVGGALSSGWLRRRLSTEAIVRAASLAMAAGAAATGASGSAALTVPALMTAGAGWVLALSTFNVSVQMSTPRWVVARALALYQMATFGGMALGAWAFGLAAEAQGIGPALLAAGALLGASVGLGLVLPLGQIEDVDLAPLDRWREPETALPVEQRSGPIVVTVEHRVAEANVPAFLDAMAERRRICRRDGARRWTLLRDLGEPELWIERFHMPTWLDYVRDTQRRTKADADNLDRIRALRLGDGTPRVRRMIERHPGSPSAATPSPQPSAREMADPMTDPTRAS